MFYEIQEEEIEAISKKILPHIDASEYKESEIEQTCKVAGVAYPLMFFAIVRMMEVGEEVNMKMKKTTKDRIDFYTL